MWVRRLAWSVAWALCVVAAGVVFVAWWCRAWVTEVSVGMEGGAGGVVRVTPSHVNVAAWPRYCWETDDANTTDAYQPVWSTDWHWWHRAITVLTCTPERQVEASSLHHRADGGDQAFLWGELGYIHGLADRWSPIPDYWEGVLPTWIVIAVLVAPLAGLATRTALRRRRRRHRIRCGRCGECDYDLTGNSTGVCPECGAPRPELAGVGGAATRY